MSRRLGRLVAASALATTALAATAAGIARPASSGIAGSISGGSFHSQALAGTVRYAVYLPPGYARSGKRYPVVYFLHGLPAGSSAYRSIEWVARAVERSGRRAIVIGVQGARSGDTDAEWRDWGSGRNWETATATELVATVDSRYRTVATRAGRVLIGVSAGGYGATLIGYHHLETFSVIQSWSGYFEPTNPAGTAVLNLGSKRANDWASMHALVRTLRGRLGSNYAKTWFSFYVGTGDTRFRQDNQQLYRELTASKVPHVMFRTYGGAHETSLWTAHAVAWISRALAVAAQPG